MPVDIVNGLISYIAPLQLASVWDGEVPRYDATGNAINPESTVSPSVWPAIKLRMDEPGFQRTWTTEDPYDDAGNIEIRIWGTTRASVMTILNSLEAKFASYTNWRAVNLGGPPSNPYYIIQMLLTRWTCIQEEEIRTGLSHLLYRGELDYYTQVHGAVSTA